MVPLGGLFYDFKPLVRLSLGEMTLEQILEWGELAFQAEGQVMPNSKVGAYFGKSRDRKESSVVAAYWTR